MGRWMEVGGWMGVGRRGSEDVRDRGEGGLATLGTARKTFWHQDGLGTKR